VVEDVAMGLTIELVARVVVVAACLSQLTAGMAVLIREGVEARPAPVERAGGPLALVNYVGIAMFIFVGLAVAITNGGAFGSLTQPLADGLRVAGILVLWAAGLLAIWGVRTMGRQLVSPAEVRPDTELVTTGAFGLVRHPLYDSVLMLWAGGTLALLNYVLGAGFVVLVPAFYLRARAEEGILTRHFGDAYIAYAARVPMLVPRLRRPLP
jgi:protein-S-isoprenylcysteine O-methyltransferase Ste14